MLTCTCFVPKINGWQSIRHQCKFCGKTHLFLCKIFKAVVWKVATASRHFLWKLGSRIFSRTALTQSSMRQNVCEVGFEPQDFIPFPLSFCKMMIYKCYLHIHLIHFLHKYKRSQEVFLFYSCIKTTFSGQREKKTERLYKCMNM